MKVIRITSKKAGFRRAGIAHPAESVDYPDGKFSATQLATLKAEPMLLVQELELPDDPKAPKGK